MVELWHINNTAKVTSSRNDAYNDAKRFTCLCVIIIMIGFRRWKGGQAVIGVRPGYAGCVKKNRGFFLKYRLVVN